MSRGKYLLINCFDAKKNGDADVDINVKIKNNKVIIGDICIPIYKHKLPTRNYYKHIIVNILRKLKKQIK